MAALQVQQDPTFTTGVNGQVQGDKGTAKSNQQTGDSSQTTDTMLADLLRKYEKAKAAIAEALIQNSNESTKNSLKETELDKALQNNPVWQSAVGSASATGGAAAQGKEYTSSDVQNFFFLIFKFLRDHKDSDSKLQVAQAVNMVAQENMLDDVTKESTMSLDKMKVDIKKAEEEANSPLAKFLKIGLPIILAVVTVVVTLASMGTAAPAAAALDAAATAGAEAGIEAGVGAGIQEGVAAGLDEGVAEGVETGTTQTVEQTTTQVTSNVGKQLTTEMLKDTIKTASKEAISNLAKGATKEATQDAVKAAVKEAVEEAVKDAVKSSVQDALAQVGEEGFSQTVQTSVKEAVTESITKTLAEATAKTGLQKAAAFASNGAVRGLAVAGIMTGIGVPMMQMAANKPDNDSTQAISNATTVEQGEMAINSAASDSIQNTLKQGMSYQQNAQSNEESDSSMLQQILQTMAKVMYLGNF